MNIPTKIRKQLDIIHENPDNQNYVISVDSGRYLSMQGDVFNIVHYHHMDRNSSNNNLWNVTQLSYEEHIINEHKNCDKIQKKMIYKNMYNMLFISRLNFIFLY